MSLRRPALTVALAIVVGILAVGCGDDKDDSPATSATGATSAASAATGSTATGATGGATGSTSKVNNSATRKALEIARDNCIAAAERLPDSSQSELTKKRCQESYDRAIKGAEQVTENIDDALEDAKKDCLEAAKRLPSGSTREAAIKTCEQLQ